MDRINWRLLRAEDIELRPAFNKNDENNVKLLLYQNARTAMDSLDDTVGQFNWQMKYTTVNNQIYGELSIYDDTKQQWVTKSDCGEKSNIAEDKGEASDIFKRCAVKWGFARELYTAPTITVPKDNFGYSGYKVTEIDYTDTRKIKHIVVANRFNKEVFRWDMDSTQQTKQHPIQEAVNATIDAAQKASAATSKKTNEQKLKQFLLDNRTDENETQLKKFVNYYMNKYWNGQMNVELLWEKWWNKAQQSTATSIS